MASARVSFWQRLQQIPRYYIYLLLAAVVIWQILFPMPLPIAPSRVTQGVYDAIAAVPDDKLILISADWDASTQAETGPQTEALIHACLQNHKRFAIMNLQPPMGVKLANDIAERVAAEYGAEYGVDWCNWGYKYGFDNVLIALAKNIPKTIGDDFHGDPVTDLPMMEGVQDISSIGLVIEITGLASITEYWIGLIQGVYGTPFASAYTAVMAPGYYPFLDSDQMKGMLVGAKGAAEMEVLVHRPAKATVIMNVQSWAHVLIIVLIIVGNLGYLFARTRGRRPA
ncbi:MAG: hypothetical protein OEV33_03635 [Armatimonadota bacterium]|nr:hypothetical protein [Armatimonadota bacterium]